LAPEYFLVNSSIYKYEVSALGKDYISQKEYNTNGIMNIEAYYDDSFNVIVRIGLVTINIDHPNEIDNIFAGKNFTIRWRASKAIENIIIELYKSWNYLETIINFTENDGQFIWNTGSLIGDNYYIKIIALENSRIFNTSQMFSIKKYAIPSYSILLTLGILLLGISFSILKSKRLGKYKKLKMASQNYSLN
jgi:hypothetical protein